MAIFRIETVKKELGYCSHTSVYEDIRLGLFTKSVKISNRSVGWPDYEVIAINTARIAGLTQNEIRELVDSLHLKRKSAFVELMGGKS